MDARSVVLAYNGSLLNGSRITVEFYQGFNDLSYEDRWTEISERDGPAMRNGSRVSIHLRFLHSVRAPSFATF